MKHLPTNMRIALGKATRLKPAAVEAAIGPLRQALQALRAGSLSEDGWIHLVSANNVAMWIEKQGVVRGLRGHLEASEQALAAVHARATGGSAERPWQATPARFEEVELIDTLVDLHRYQLEQLSFGEYQRANQAAIAEVQSSGGRVVQASELRGGA